MGVGNFAYINVATLTHLTLVAHGHVFHARVDSHHVATAVTSLDFAQCDTAVFVFRRHFLPLLNLGNTGASHRVKRVGHSLSALHITQLDERNGNQAWAAETTDGFGDKPLRVRLGDDDNGFARLRVQFIGSLGLKVVLDNSIDHGALTLECRHPECAVFGDGRILGKTAVGES